jgi:AcrR family transcriptional regulator
MRLKAGTRVKLLDTAQREGLGNTLPRVRASRAAPQERQQAILKAALEVFSEHGFAAARLEDIARRAGVAKGTLYLYFPDKETLFERMLQSVTAPALALLAELAADKSRPPAAALSQLLTFIQTEVLNTDREKVIRLIIAEGARFPRLAKFYHDEVISKGLTAVRTIAARDDDTPNMKALARFPQLLFAPFLMSIVWRGLFSELECLDLAALLAAHKQILLQPEGEARS